MFKPHIGICVDCGNKRLLVVKANLCVKCNHAKKQAAKGNKATARIAPLSDKREKEQRLYSVARKIYLKHNTLCKAKIAGICHVASSQVHHKRGRIGKLFLDQRYWLPVCTPCHHHIETHPEEAKEKGWSESRLSENG